MTVYQEVKEKVQQKEWRSAPYRGFGADSPGQTLNEVVSLAFDQVSQNYNRARHCHLYEMYNPILGDFRRRPYYTSLAPSLCISRPHEARAMLEGVPNPCCNHVNRGLALSRGHYYLPTSSRLRNYIDYWEGRKSGLDYAAPFLRYEDYTPTEDRRYQRLYWSPSFIDLLPTCRHARQLMLSAY